jgi:hypothetical protein
MNHDSRIMSCFSSTAGNCRTRLQINGESYASYRAMVRFNSTNTTEMADMMFAGIGSGAGRPCAGSYSRILYANMAALFAVGPFKVSQNSERL